MLLDTSFCIDLMKEQAGGRKGPATEKLISLGEERLAISVFTLGELFAGAESSKNARREHERLKALIDTIEVVYPRERFARLYGETVSFLKHSGTPIPLMDVLIGTSAKEHGLTVITRDVSHFRKIPMLSVMEY
jgi:predicted nucleic acid-binding protein